MAKKNMNYGGNLFKEEIIDVPGGYYSGDKPNPNLRAFVEEHIKEKPYDFLTDEYRVSAFDKSIETTKATSIYNMHTYWSKKPHDAIQEYIKHYTSPGDLVLDLFCGSGGTALAALMDGRKAIAIDRSPAATFITKNYCTPVDIENLKIEFEKLKFKVQNEIESLYETRCDRCGGKAITAFTVYSNVYQCSRCMKKVPLYDCVTKNEVTTDGKIKKINACPHCLERGIIEEIKTSGERYGSVPVVNNYICLGNCKPQRSSRKHDDLDSKKREYFQSYDLSKLLEIEKKQIPHWYPKDRMMHAPENQECWGAEWRPGRNFRSVDELFTKRNLWALSAILENINSIKNANLKESLLFTFTSILLKSSKMMAHNSDGIGRIQKGTYYLPQIQHDINVWRFMEEALGDMVLGYNNINRELRKSDNVKLIISTDDARNLDIPSMSIDYIFTDPPYAEKVQYGELNFIWESWLGLDTHWHKDEIIVNEVRKKTTDEWVTMFRQAIKECYRVLKPGRVISICYHDTSAGTWGILQDIMHESGFIVEKAEKAVYIDTKTKTTNQYFADKVNKRDLVINFRKPRVGELSTYTFLSENEEVTFNEKVKVIIKDYLTQNPGTTKDRIYDEVVSHMVRNGCMESHNFDEILIQVADEVREQVKEDLFKYRDPDLFGSHEISRWFIKEAESELIDFSETEKEDKSATVIENFIKDYLNDNPVNEGVHYSDIFEQYIYLVADKPRRQLSDWLIDYFYKTPEGTYRLPANEEEAEAKAKGRASGMNRSIKRYVALLEQGGIIPNSQRVNDATLAEWIRQCKRTALFEYGKILYEKGGLNLDNLPEELLVDVEEDYQVCVRMLAREQSNASQKPKRKKKE